MTDTTDGGPAVDHPLPPPSPHMVMMTDGMVDALGPGSFTSIAGFDALLLRDLSHIADLTDGRIGMTVTKAGPGAEWVGKAWHTNHLELRLVLITKGWAQIEFEGMDPVRYGEGAVLVPPSENRHRILGVSPDYEALSLTLPAQFTSTLFRYDDRIGEYRTIVVDTGVPDAVDRADASA